MLLNILIIIAVSFAVFQLIVLTILRKKMGKHKFYLAPVLLGLVWILTEFLAARNVVNIGFDLFYGTQYGSWLLLGPSFLFFGRKSLPTRGIFAFSPRHRH